jgi:hypothetical protein
MSLCYKFNLSLTFFAFILHTSILSHFWTSHVSFLATISNGILDFQHPPLPHTYWKHADFLPHFSLTDTIIFIQHSTERTAPILHLMTQEANMFVALLPLGSTKKLISLYVGTVLYSCLKNRQDNISFCTDRILLHQTLSKLKKKKTSLNVRNMKMLKKINKYSINLKKKITINILCVHFAGMHVL